MLRFLLVWLLLTIVLVIALGLFSSLGRLELGVIVMVSGIIAAVWWLAELRLNAPVPERPVGPANAGEVRPGSAGGVAHGLGNP